MRVARGNRSKPEIAEEGRRRQPLIGLVNYLLLVFPDPDGGRPRDDHLVPPLPLVPGEVAAHLGVAGRHLNTEIIVTLNYLRSWQTSFIVIYSYSFYTELNKQMIMSEGCL